ncbi:hypothetical protein HK103_002803 [Boothiomyces macroporosus]|uniref:Uncharacterized protein n=1 Tax=Boothiomyces macroporosus TaxID=261099 RepID=A0AAD5Y9B8_9FUNG|nr:hypothetical protein HK103_004082 [Boothiomyces macroporosus]KAJ3259156.1 hypothetical protein HK103_002803 [Boothiomyces macroporosus]
MNPENPDPTKEIVDHNQDVEEAEPIRQRVKVGVHKPMNDIEPSKDALSAKEAEIVAGPTDANTQELLPPTGDESVSPDLPKEETEDEKKERMKQEWISVYTNTYSRFAKNSAVTVINPD